MSSYISLNIAIEFICLVAAIIFLSSDRSLVWKSGIVFMLITVSVEELGLHYKLINDDHFNAAVYNLLTIPESIFISSMFYLVLKPYFKCLPILLIGLAIIASFYISALISHGIYVYMDSTNTTMSVVFSIYGFIYFYLLIKSEGYVILRNYAPFWWVTGSLMYYFGALAIDFLFWTVRFPNSVGSQLYSYVYTALNLFLYGFWSYSFLCRYLLRKSNYLSY